MAALAVIGLVVGGLAHLAARPPETPTTPETAAEAATWAGFPQTAGLRERYVYREEDRLGARSLVLEGSPDAVDRFLAAGGFAGEWLSCSEAHIQHVGVTKLSDCRSARDEWRRSDGARIIREVTRGQPADGGNLVDVKAFVAQPTTGTTR
jgi:hypothetical protein